MTKKLLSLVLVVALGTTLVACGGGETTAPEGGESTESPTESPSN